MLCAQVKAELGRKKRNGKEIQVPFLAANIPKMHTTVNYFSLVSAAGQGRNKKKGLLAMLCLRKRNQRFLGDPGKQSTEIEFLEIFLDNTRLQVSLSRSNLAQRFCTRARTSRSRSPRSTRRAPKNKTVQPRP